MVPLHSNKTLTKEVFFICLFGFFCVCEYDFNADNSALENL